MVTAKNFGARKGSFPNVVVSAVEIITSVGVDTESSWKALLDGRSGVRPLDDPEIAKLDLPVTFGAKFLSDPTEEVDRVQKRRMSYVEQVGHVISKRLWTNNGNPDVDPDRLAVIVGTGLGGGEVIIDMCDKVRQGGYRKISPFVVQMAMPNGSAAVIGLQIGARAGVITPVSACATGCEALIHAWRHIVLGEADMVVAGGVEGEISAMPIASFSMMRAVSTRNDEPEKASRPFDRDRDGFVFGEAAALFIVETEEHCLARGAKPIARLLGTGITSDGYHMVAPDPEGTGAARAMRRAIELAGINAREIDHINAHATGTPLGDLAEAKAINAVIGKNAAVYAPKGALGHSIGSVGALESALTVLSIRDQIIPPTLNLDNQDPEVDLDIVHGEARHAKIDFAINDSFGFGGHNAAIVFGKY